MEFTSESVITVCIFQDRSVHLCIFPKDCIQSCNGIQTSSCIFHGRRPVPVIGNRAVKSVISRPSHTRYLPVHSVLSLVFSGIGTSMKHLRVHPGHEASLHPPKQIFIRLTVCISELCRTFKRITLFSSQMCRCRHCF